MSSAIRSSLPKDLQRETKPNQVANTPKVSIFFNDLPNDLIFMKASLNLTTGQAYDSILNYTNIRWF